MSKLKGGTKVKVIEDGCYRGVRYKEGEIWTVIDSECIDNIIVSKSGVKDSNYTLLAHDEYEVFVEEPTSFAKQLEQLNADVKTAQECLDRAIVSLQAVKKLMEFFKEG
jgi:hypothetical protein